VSLFLINDYVFASIKMRGKQPIWPNSALEDHIRPAAKRAGITKRIGWHTLRHTFGTLLKANGEDVPTVQALMRHANVSITMNTYVQAVTPAKRKAQGGIIKQIREVAPDGPGPNLKYLQVIEKMVGAIGFEPMTSTV
jgi:integrase